MLEQALDDCNPERDAEARFRFGRDTGVSAAVNLSRCRVAYWARSNAPRS